MATNKVSNEMLYELLKTQDRSLQLIDKRLDQIDQRFNQIDKRLDRLEDKVDHMDQRLRRVETSIEGVRISWSKRLAAAILGSSAVTSAIVAYVVSSIL